MNKNENIEAVTEEVTEEVVETVSEPDNRDYGSWIEAILMVAKHYRIECSKENILLTSHWLSDRPISDVLRSIARQAGLSFSVIKLEDSELSVWRLPLVVQLKEGQIGVIDAIDKDGDLGITYSGDGGLKSRIS